MYLDSYIARWSERIKPDHSQLVHLYTFALKRREDDDWISFTLGSESSWDKQNVDFKSTASPSFPSLSREWNTTYHMIWKGKRGVSLHVKAEETLGSFPY